MTYAYDALARVASEPNPWGRVALDAAVLVAAAMLRALPWRSDASPPHRLSVG